jgi:hypothetical protein
LLPLDLKRNIVGKLSGRFLKPLVEGWHESEEILQEVPMLPALTFRVCQLCGAHDYRVHYFSV